MVMSGLVSLFSVAVLGSNAGKCGIASNPDQCGADLAYLSGFGDTSNINCMGYGGASDPCTLNIYHDPDQGSDKDPSNCNSGVLILWDEPETQGQSVQWAAATWASYAARWSGQLRAKRANGMQVTTPMFTNSDAHHIDSKMSEFFAACAGCNDPNSDQYINILMWNAWIGSWNPTIADGASWIKQQSAAMKSAHGNRPVWLGNYGYLGADATGQKELDVIWSSGIMYPWDSGIDSVYYFTAKDYGGGTAEGVNDIRTAVGQTTIGQELMKVCIGSSPAPSPASCTPQGADPYASGAHIACCYGLNEQVANWDGDGRYYYKCVAGDIML